MPLRYASTAYAARRPSAIEATTVAAPVRTSPVPNTPLRPVAKVTASAARRRCLLGPTPSAPRDGPAQVRALADGQQHPVALDDELGARRPAPGGGGRRHPGAPSAMRWNSMPVTLLFASVTTRTGAAWKMARAPSSIISWTSFARGHVLHVAAVDQRDLRAALAHRRAGAVHGREAAADDHDALAGVVRIGQAEGGDAQVLQAVEDAVRVLTRDAQLVRVVAADRDHHGVDSPGSGGPRS